MTQAAKQPPAGYHTLQPYLHFPNTLEAFDFYQKVYGATERLCMKNEEGGVVHAELQIGDSCIMLSDEVPHLGFFSPRHYGGSPISLMIYVEDCDDVYQQALAAGAVSVREPADQPYGARTCGVKDPFGYTWWLHTHLKELTREELENLT